MVLGSTGWFLPVEVDQPCSACPVLLRLGRCKLRVSRMLTRGLVLPLLRILKRCPDC